MQRNKVTVWVFPKGIARDLKGLYLIRRIRWDMEPFNDVFNRGRNFSPTHEEHRLGGWPDHVFPDSSPHGGCPVDYLQQHETPAEDKILFGERGYSLKLLCELRTECESRPVDIQRPAAVLSFELLGEILSVQYLDCNSVAFLLGKVSLKPCIHKKPPCPESWFTV